MSIRARFAVSRGDFLLDVDLDIAGKGVTAIFGESGCGKTTLLRAIAGLDRHDQGLLSFGDKVWQDGSTFVPPHERSIGYVFQEASLFPHLSVRGNLNFGLSRAGRGAQKIPFTAAVELLGIGDLLDRSPETLSGGEQQRVGIARALLAGPEVLLMDEPLASLDSARKQEILNYIAGLQRDLELPVLYVSHDRDEVARLADDLLLMSRGRIEAHGNISEMLTRLDLSLVHSSDAEAVISAVVCGHDEEYELTFLDSAAGKVTVTGNELPVGASTRIRILARDVSITRKRQTDTSILNIFPATVDELVPEGGAQVTVRLLVGRVPLLARITRKSAHNLGLRPGIEVFAQTKSVALLA
jgi:molybdate transport system ATP-binding protein